jgi:hypothetical protein
MEQKQAAARDAEPHEQIADLAIRAEALQ